MNKPTARRKSSSKKKSTKSTIWFYVVAFSILLTFGYFAKSEFIVSSQQSVMGATSENEIIVKYKSATPETDRQAQRKALKTIVRQQNKQIGFEVVQIQEGTVSEVIKKYKQNPQVEYAEPNFKATMFVVSNDTALQQQWGLFKINAANHSAKSAWDITTGNEQIKVAVLDTGIEATHADLTGKVVAEFNFTDSASANDANGHGTHVAGIAAAATNNGSGIAGSGYNTTLLNGKVLGDDGSGYYSWIANGIVWAADQGAKVINLSLGGPSSSQAMQDAINYAWSKGAVVVAAAGNNNTNTPNYPGYYTNVIAVAATDSNDARASFSNYGSWVDVAAPGVAIYSTYKGNTYASMSGTSMATPFTAGTAALIWANGSCASNTCVREQLEKTADKINGTGTNWVWGRINANTAVANVIVPPTPTLIPTSSPSGTPVPTSSIAKVMTVSDLDMSYTTVTATSRKIYAAIKVSNSSSTSPLPTAYVRATLTSPSGKVSNFSGYTKTNGVVTFNTKSNEKGTFTTKVTNVTKTGFTYSPSITSTTLVVQ